MLVPFSLAFGLALITALVGTPLVRTLATRLRILDQPGGRRIHSQPVPRLGGIAIFFAFVVGETTAWMAIRAGWVWPPLEGFMPGELLYPGHAVLRRVFLVSAAVVLLGSIDDICNVSGPTKLVFQVSIAALAVVLGFRIEAMTGPFGDALFVGHLGIPITMFWILVLMNGVNFVDGIDGLAAGLTMIASLALFVIAILRGNLEIALLLTGLAGAILGFMRYNLHPASIFMGDSGSLFLGTTLALITIVASFKSTAAIALIVPMIVLTLPLAEIISTTLRRLFRGQPVFRADRRHLHHRLLQRGLSTPQVVGIFYAVALAAGVLAIAVIQLRRQFFAPILLIILVLGVLGLRLYLRHRPEDGLERNGE